MVSCDAGLMTTQLTSQGPLGSELFIGHKGQDLHIPPSFCRSGRLWTEHDSWGQQVFPLRRNPDATYNVCPVRKLRLEELKLLTCPGQADKE